MPAELIARHLKTTLGIDVGVTFDDLEAPRQVHLYRPDRLSEDFVALALQALEETAPHALRQIESVLVSFETPVGRSRRRVDFRSRGPDEAAVSAA
jgi:hypothetical protein